MPSHEGGGILLAGPPASGKRTVAFSLTALRRAYAHVPALATDPRRSVDAVQASQRHLDELRSWAQILYDVTLDGVRYSHDRERLTQARERGVLPVVCVEETRALDAFEAESEGWIPVLLWCPRAEAERRSAGLPDAVGRSWTRRWDRSAKGLLADPGRFTLTLRSDRLAAMDIARIVHLAAQGSAHDAAELGGPAGVPHRR